MKTIYLFCQGFKIHLFPVCLLSVILNLFHHLVRSIMLQLHRTLKQVQRRQLKTGYKNQSLFIIYFAFDSAHLIFLTLLSTCKSSVITYQLFFFLSFRLARNLSFKKDSRCESSLRVATTRQAEMTTTLVSQVNKLYLFIALIALLSLAVFKTQMEVFPVPAVP
jgi:hypothetical protein